MIFRSTLAALLLAASAFAQNTQVSTGPNSPNISGSGNSVSYQSGKIDVKSSPASDALIAAAKEYTSSQAALDTMRQQAMSALQQNQKALQDQLTAAQKSLDDKIRADKKYKSEFDNIANLQKQLTDINTTANTKFGQQASPLMQKINTDKPLMDGLIPIVRKENNLPDNAAFDEKTQTWSVPAKPAEAPKK